MARCEVQDGQALTLPSSSFDAVFSAFGVFLFRNRLAGWREAARVLAPNGLLATAVWRGPEDNELARLQMAPVIANLPERIRSTLPRGWLEIATCEGLERELASCGFTAIEITEHEAVLTAPTPHAMWAAMQENPITGPLFTPCTAEELAVIERAVLASFTELAGGRDRSMRFAASCHFAVARPAGSVPRNG